ncbi:primary-amine oxidase [Colletotrichum incanum]|uniref:Amine oxidase n=1 Tax=Colletotrichum incanum TaxID=1573173 RepID=A0A167BAX4_COLIC|nr:primary-amine oxidase [Colletotrichum incanum]
MVVPYGNSDSPHQRKHPFDVGEYGSGLMTNSLKLGWDCKSAIHYLDAVMTTSKGKPAMTKNAIYIHEEDNGLLYKHTDFRNGSKLEIKLTGMLNLYCMHPSELAAPYGTEVTPELSAHNHQYIFSLRVDPEIDGPNNSVLQSDALPAEQPVEPRENPFGNGFYCKKTPLRTAQEGAAVYRHGTSRAWDIINPSSINASTKKPVGYEIISPNWPLLLAQPGSMVYKRAAFAHKSLWSTGAENYPHNQTIVDWVARNESIENTDVVYYVQFGLTHVLRTEDFTIMPAEPVSVMLRAPNFFSKNPGLWIPPSSVSIDRTSRGAFCANRGGEKLCQAVKDGARWAVRL